MGVVTLLLFCMIVFHVFAFSLQCVLQVKVVFTFIVIMQLCKRSVMCSLSSNVYR